MKKLLLAGLLAGAMAVAADASYADGRPILWFEPVQFAVLPGDLRYPEGITANPATGDIFVGTFDFGPNTNVLLRFDHGGHVSAHRDFGGTPLLGLGFDASQVAFDPYGNMYFSDSFQGAINKIPSVATCARPCAVLTLVHDPLLATAGFPPFGANGLAISADVTTMYIANTGDNRVLRMDMTNGHLSVFAESLHGADGLLFDSDGYLWVAANQADELVRLDSRGRPNAKIGRFPGIREDGTPRGFLFPASKVIVDGVMYVTNLALPLTPAVGDEPEEDVTRWNIVRMRVTRH
jgi:DNA-binding beta-propeller fold protein YncE